MTWTPVSTNSLPPKKRRLCKKDWTQSAVECHASNKNCDGCIIFTAMEKSWANGGCKIPVTVQRLLDAGISPPKEARFHGGFKKVLPLFL